MTTIEKLDAMFGVQGKLVSQCQDTADNGEVGSRVCIQVLHKNLAVAFFETISQLGNREEGFRADRAFAKGVLYFGEMGEGAVAHMVVSLLAPERDAWGEGAG